MDKKDLIDALYELDEQESEGGDIIHGEKFQR